MNPLRFEQIAFFDAGPLGLVDLAAEFDIPLVSFWTVPGAKVDGVTLVTAESMRSVRERLDGTGVKADSVEVFSLGSSPDLDVWRRACEIASYLGATSAAAINGDLTDLHEAADALGQFASVVGEYGLTPGFEPTTRGATRTLADAGEIIEASGRTDVKIAVDVLHLVRTGGSPADVARLAPSSIAYAQICDGPASMTPEGYRAEGAYNRQAPGEGDFPLVEFVASLPKDVALGIEVPMIQRQAAGMTPRERAQLLAESTRSVQRRAEEAAPSSR